MPLRLQDQRTHGIRIDERGFRRWCGGRYWNHGCKEDRGIESRGDHSRKLRGGIQTEAGDKAGVFEAEEAWEARLKKFCVHEVRTVYDHGIE